jgi:YgiT-type zinc finger domain-containing protein
VVDYTQQAGSVDMRPIANSKCSECGGQVRRKTIAQEFEKEGVTVKLSGLKAWVCVRCGEVYFEPGGAQQVVQAVNSLFELAFAERQHKGTLSAQLS